MSERKTGHGAGSARANERVAVRVPAYRREQLALSRNGSMNGSISELLAVASANDVAGSSNRSGFHVALVQGASVAAACRQNKSEEFTSGSGEIAHRLQRMCTASTHSSAGASEFAGNHSSISPAVMSQGIYGEEIKC